ncbi:MAG: pilin [bacterium]|nr:pilin [bacterium]MDZ4295780.1 pilin [Patescibacteria group bacterium]
MRQQATSSLLAGLLAFAVCAVMVLLVPVTTRGEDSPTSGSSGTQPGTGSSGTQPGTGETQPQTFVIPRPGDIKDLNDLLDRVLKFLRTIGAPIATIMIIYAGLTYIFAAGNSEKITQARSILLYTVIGYGIILVASGLLYVIQDFFGVSSS